MSKMAVSRGHGCWCHVGGVSFSRFAAYMRASCCGRQVLGFMRWLGEVVVVRELAGRGGGCLARSGRSTFAIDLGNSTQPAWNPQVLVLPCNYNLYTLR